MNRGYTVGRVVPLRGTPNEILPLPVGTPVGGTGAKVTRLEALNFQPGYEVVRAVHRLRMDVTRLVREISALIDEANRLMRVMRNIQRSA